MRKNRYLLICIIVFTFFIRFIPLNFPVFSSDEARISFRAYALSVTGKDELGRSFPMLFNSLEDYQLPVVSYVTTLGVMIFGKTDFGVRIPFILIGTAVVFLIYKLSKFFSEGENYGFYAAVIASLSPGLIFFSKFPNEYIVAAFLILLLVTQMLNKRVKKIQILIIILLMLFTSKILWLVLIPLYSLSLFLNHNLQIREKMSLLLVGITPVLMIVLFYLMIPQGARSIIENNFLIFRDVNVKNGIEKLRSQHIEIWPIFFDRILFNKLYLFLAGAFHWLSHISLSRLFTEFDSTGSFGFLKIGAFSKIGIIPFLSGLFYLAKNRNKIKSVPLLIIITTLPIVFLYPVERISFIVPALPFIALICGFGFKLFSRKIATILIVFMILEFSVNLLFVDSSIKNANEYRQPWIKQIIKDAYGFSVNYNVAFSDNIVSDIVPFIEWYSNIDPSLAYENISYPYRYRQTKISNYKIIGSEDTFYNCGLDKNTYIFASKRDLRKIQLDIKVGYLKSYKDEMENEAVYLLPSKICVH